MIPKVDYTIDTGIKPVSLQKYVQYQQEREKAKYEKSVRITHLKEFKQV